MAPLALRKEATICWDPLRLIMRAKSSAQVAWNNGLGTPNCVRSFHTVRAVGAWTQRRSPCCLKKAWIRSNTRAKRTLKTTSAQPSPGLVPLWVSTKWSWSKRNHVDCRLSLRSNIRCIWGPFVASGVSLLVVLMGSPSQCGVMLYLGPMASRASKNYKMRCPAMPIETIAQHSFAMSWEAYPNNCMSCA